MNLAFPTALLFILILPGFILRYTLVKGFRRWDNPVVVQALSDEIARSIIAAGVLHAIWASLVMDVLHQPIDFHSLILLLLSNFGAGNLELSHVVSSIADHPYPIFWYFTSLNLFAAISGSVTHHTIRYLKWDVRYKWARFNDEWYYLLTGEVINFDQKKRRNIAAVYLSAVVNQGDRSYLYQGEIMDWSYDRSGNLQWVLLMETLRRPFSPENDRPNLAPENTTSHENDGRFYAIYGDRFILRMSEIITLNLEYVILDLLTDQ